MAEKEEASSQSIETEAGDGEFEPTVEMMVNDFDDERTLDEEEALEESENQEEEINDLTKEQDMPIEQLLAIYGSSPPKEETDGRNGELEEGESVNNEEEEEEEEEEPIGEYGDIITSHSSGSDENMNNTDIDKDATLEAKPERRKKEKTSDLVQLYPELDSNGDSTGGATARSLRSGSRQQSEDEEEEGEEASGEEEEDWRKTIMIGSAYQAQVPEGLQAYGDTPPYENEDRLLWETSVVNPDQVESYLTTFSKRNKSSQGVASLPLGSHVRDDEYALHLLLQCGYNVDEALRRQKMNPVKPVSQMTLWSEEECRNFENGLKTYGKDFHLIQQNKVRTRSVGELVQFYYLWKKTERHDMFATKTRIEKKKYIVHPGTTDYMDRFLDEGEGAPSIPTSYMRDSPGVHTLLYGKCPPGVAPPIPTSTIASATIAFMTASSNNIGKPLNTSSTVVNSSLRTSSNLSLSPSLFPRNQSPSLAQNSPATTNSRAGSPRLEAMATSSNRIPERETSSPNSPSSRARSPLNKGSKRSMSPSVDMKMSLSPQSPIVHSGLSPGLQKAETVAL